MYPYLGDFPVNAVIFFPFHTFDSNGGSVTITGLAVTDIEVFKGTSMTQRASDNGYALVDTDGIDLDGFTGFHGFTIDTSDNSTAGFYAAGNEYTVLVATVTIDAQTVRFIAGTFSIERAGGALALIKDATNGLTAIKNAVNTVDDFVDTEVASILAAVDTEVAAIITTLGAAGAGLTAVPWNASWDTEVQSEVQDAIEVNHLDHLLAQDYNPAAKPGSATALLNEIIGSDGGVSQFTLNALELAPAGGAGSVAVLLSGTAQAGGASTITLAAAATSVDNQLALDTIQLTSGTGAGQSRQIISGVTSTEVMTVNEPWTIQPDNTTIYQVLGNGISAATLQDIEDTMWDAQRGDHQVAGSFGERVFTDVTHISGDSVAADKAEEFFDGTVMALANVTIGTVTTLTGHTPQTGNSYARLGAPVGASISADIAAVKAQAVAIEADTNELQLDWANGGRLDNILDARASQASVDTVDTVVDAILVDTGTTLDTNITAIKTKTDSLTFTVANQVDAGVRSVNGVTVTGGSGTPWGRT